MVDYTRIAACAPANATAAKQLARNPGFTPAVEIQDYWADMPPVKRPSPEKLRSPMFIDFTGREYGRLKVVGLLADKNPKRPASWVCRCKCGGFCSRTSKSLKGAEQGDDGFKAMCGLCDYTRKLKEGWAPQSVKPMGWQTAWRAPRWKGSAP